jgi:hypothetical protein
MDQSAFRALLSVPSDRPAAAVKPKPRPNKYEGGGKKAAPAFKPRAARPVAKGGDEAHYRDRANERRHHAHDGDEALYSKLDYATSKFVGGDLEHTHLVKGLDFALLRMLQADGEAAAGGDGEGGEEEEFEALANAGGAGAGAAAPALSAWSAGILAAVAEAHPATAGGAGGSGATDYASRLRSLQGEGGRSARRSAWDAGRVTFRFTLSREGGPGEDGMPAVVMRGGEEGGGGEAAGLIDALDPSLLSRIEDAVHFRDTGVRRATGVDKARAMPQPPPVMPAATLPVAPAPVELEVEEDDIFAGIGQYRYVVPAPAPAVAMMPLPPAAPAPAGGAMDEGGAYPDTDAQYASADAAYPDTDAQFEQGPMPPPPSAPPRRAVRVDADVAVVPGFDEEGLAEWEEAEGGGADTVAEVSRKAKEEVYRHLLEGEAHPARATEEEGEEGEGGDLGPTSSYLQAAREELAALAGGRSAAIRGAATSRAGSGGFSVVIGDDDLAGLGGGLEAFSEKERASRKRSAAEAALQVIRGGKKGRKEALDAAGALRAGRFETLGEGAAAGEARRSAGGPALAGSGPMRSNWDARRFGQEEDGGGRGGAEENRKKQALDNDYVKITAILEAKAGSAGFGVDAVVGRGGAMPGAKGKRRGYDGGEG